jgi:hypothetical protein
MAIYSDTNPSWQAPVLGSDKKSVITAPTHQDNIDRPGRVTREYREIASVVLWRESDHASNEKSIDDERIATCMTFLWLGRKSRDKWRGGSVSRLVYPMVWACGQSLLNDVKRSEEGFIGTLSPGRWYGTEGFSANFMTELPIIHSPTMTTIALRYRHMVYLMLIMRIAIRVW